MQTVRTTIELDRQLLKRTKQKALEEDKTLREIITDALQKEIIAPLKKRGKRRKIKIRTYNMGKVKGTLSREEIYYWL